MHIIHVHSNSCNGHVNRETHCPPKLLIVRKVILHYRLKLGSFSFYLEDISTLKIGEISGGNCWFSLMKSFATF